MDVQREVSSIARKLMFREPYYGLLLIGLNKAYTDNENICPTAGVSKNGINAQLIVNTNFWKSLEGENPKLGLLKHELLHLAFFHLTLRDQFYDKLLFNIAADIEINQYIDPSWAPSPDWLLPSSYPDLNLPTKAGTKVYYDLLKQELENNPNGQFAQDYDNMSDDVSHWAQHGTWNEFDDLSESEKKLIQKQFEYQMKEAATALGAQKNRGLIPGELQELIDKLFTEREEPVMDWKSYFRRFVGNSNKVYTKKTRRKENKRYGSPNPALRVKTKKHVLCAVDTSGSVSNQELVEFFTEIDHIHRTGVQVTVLQFDADVHHIAEYKGKFDGVVYGRGGTSFQPPVDYYLQHPEYNSLIMLTDGYAPSPKAPSTKTNSILWVSSQLKVEDMNDFPGLKVKMNING